MDEDERHEVSERENMAAVDNITKIFDWDLQNGDLSAWFRLSELWFQKPFLGYVLRFRLHLFPVR